jgi:segregation and condensation protein A
MQEAPFDSLVGAYPVKLQNFEGPLDLLLHLIKQNEMDIYDIQIATITRQYLEYLELLTELNLDVAGEFLVMAATLIHIKSRTLLPRPDPSQEQPDEDPREALVRRLLEHQRFKAAAELLHEKEIQRSAQWGRPDDRVAAVVGEAPEPEIEADLFSLMTAFRQVLERARRRPYVPLPPEQISIEARIEQLLALLTGREACAFDELFADAATRSGMIVTFLALLEMIRLRRVRVIQPAGGGAIRVYRVIPPEPAAEPTARSAEVSLDAARDPAGE